jgi:hypothetical protein
MRLFIDLVSFALKKNANKPIGTYLNELLELTQAVTEQLFVRSFVRSVGSRGRTEAEVTVK